MSIALTTAKASCPVDGCDFTAAQIDTTRERAVEVVTEAVHRHLDAEHAEGTTDDG